ncbi:nucleoporin p58/p45 isoform X2 [Zootermopsis nevadensis]|uniref:nucleoporin p58/p45 isoform X2 n=1 Tax=Zootermopsis nevadensis TaxID=136037 RepID=UPI000B8E47B3|nr:nucleoporin p58/p45 isoform X2 [Zootermopsis nevadensis]
MSGFGFGSTGSTTPGTAFNLGSNKTTTSGFTLGTTTAPLSSGSLFGTTSTFGTPTTLSSGLSFGAAATSQPATGLFGSPAGQTTGLSFGISVPSAAPTGLTFSNISTPTGLSFGTPTVGQTGGISFGNAATPAGQTGLSFGPPATTATGLTFGTPATTIAQSGLSFGTSTGLAFGTPTTSVAPSTGLIFGTPNVTTTQTGLTFAAPATTLGISGSLSFGNPAPTSAAPLSFPGLSTAVTTAAKPLGGLPFGTSTAVTSATGFSLPTPATTSQGTGFTLGGTTTSISGGGLFGLGSTKPLLFSPSTSTTTSVGHAGTSVPMTTTLVGLGGVDASQAKSGLTGTSPRRSDVKAVKENQIPNEILQTIETFKNIVKTQKGLSSDIARGSVKPLHKVQEDTESLKQMLAGLTSGLQRNGALADKLKADTAKCLHQAEMAQRTHETPPGLQYDNVAPIEYFTELVAGFERDMQVFRQEIENTEKHILSLSHPMALTPQELALAMRRLHDSFVALAGRLQTVHNSVEMQKEQYLNLRKYFLKDSTNVFEEQAKKSAAGGIKPSNGVKISPGPTPFSVLGNQHGFGLLPANSAEPKHSFPPGNPLGWCGGQQPSQLPANLCGNLFSSGGLSSSLNTLPTPQPVDNQSFQLQKPPPGSKRGKR